MERHGSGRFFPDLIPGPANRASVQMRGNEESGIPREGLIYPEEEWDGLDGFEPGCGRSAESVEFSEKAVGWGCFLFIVLTAVAGVIAMLEQLGL